MRFNLRHIIYATALVASSLAAFGELGFAVVAALGCAIIWQILWGNALERILPTFLTASRRQRSREDAAVGFRKQLTLPEFLVIVAILGVLGGLCIPATGRNRQQAMVHAIASDMGWMISAVRNFEQINDRLPSDLSTAGELQLTWRIEVLDLGNDDLLAQSRSLPKWDAAVEQQLEQARPYRLDNHFYRFGADVTYAAVRGNRTWWDDMSQTRALDGSGDADGDTVVLILDENSTEPWYVASDVTFDEALRYLIRDDVRPGVPVLNTGFFHKPCQPRVVAFADRDVRIFYAPLPEDLARAILTARGGESVDRALLERLARPQVNWSRIYAVFLFALVAVYPVWPLWRRRRSAKRAAG